MFALLLAATLTVHDYAAMPLPSSPVWSPDGTRIAYVLTTADFERSVYDSDVWLIGANGSGGRRLTRGPGADFAPRWSPDGRTIALLSDRGGRNDVWLIAPDGGEARQLTREPAAVRALAWTPDGTRIVFLRPDEETAAEKKRAEEKDDARIAGQGTRHVHLHVADVATGAVRRVTGGDGSVFDFSVAPDGASVVFSIGPGPGLDGMYQTDLYRVSLDVSGDALPAPVPVVVRPGIDRTPVCSPDGRWIAFTSSGGDARWIVEHDVHVVAAAGGPSRNVSGAYGRTPEQLAWSDDSKFLWITGPWNTTSQLFRVNADGSGLTDRTKVAGVVSDTDLHGARAVYVYQSLTEPPEVFAEGRRLTSHNDAYGNRTLGATRLIRWKNPKDGLEIEGLLTLPVGYREGTRVPLLTFVHGGPASRFDQGFLGYLGHVYAPQALAANGFAVLRPNPRGTGGYGAEFRQANLADWGGLDWLDVTAGIDRLIADGIADPDELGLMGWSYGGFLAAWALGESDRFAAVSVGAPVVDLLSFHGTTDIRDFVPSYFPDPGTARGAAWRDLLRAHSPAWRLKKTAAKVLVQHGEADDRVPISQGMLLYRLLEENGSDVTMVAYPRTPHVPREPKLRVDVARRNLVLFTDVFGAATP